MPDNKAKDSREVFRYRKGDELRIYQLRAIPGGAELWRVTEKAGQPPAVLKEDDFTNPDELMRTLEDLQRRLTAGGFTPCAS